MPRQKVPQTVKANGGAQPVVPATRAIDDELSAADPNERFSVKKAVANWRVHVRAG